MYLLNLGDFNEIKFNADKAKNKIKIVLKETRFIYYW